MREDLARREAFQRDRRYSDQLRDRIVDDYARIDRDEAMRTIINDPEIVLDAEMVEVVNNPDIEVDMEMRPMRRRGPSRSSPSAFASQFRLDRILPRTTKRTRKKTSTDKKMSAALKKANSKLRNKNGKLKKGKTMRDVMKMAHRLRKK